MTSKEILIFEPHAAGHRMQHVRRLVEAFGHAQIVPIVLLTTREALSHPATAFLVGRNGNSPIVEEVDIPSYLGWRFLVVRKLREQFRYASALRISFRELGGAKRFSFVLIPYLEYCSVPLALWRLPFDGVPWAGLTMRTRFHLRRMDIVSPRRFLTPVEQYIFRRMLRDPSMAALFTLDPYLAEFARNSKVVHLRDPAEVGLLGTKIEARTGLGLEEGAIVVLAYGSLDRRKCIDVLVDAVARHVDAPQITVLVVGKVAADVRSVLAGASARTLRRQSRLVVVDRFQTPEEEDSVFLAADLIWVTYRDHSGSSGVLAKAGRIGRPVIASTEGIIGRMVDEYGFGLTIDWRDRVAAARAIDRLAKDPIERSRCSEASRAYFGSHTPEAFAAPVVAIVRAAMEGR